MSTRCKPGDMVIVEAQSGLDPCAAEHRGLTFVVHDSAMGMIIESRIVIAPVWFAARPIQCPRCRGFREAFLDLDLRPLRGPAPAASDVVDQPRTLIEEPAHG